MILEFICYWIREGDFKKLIAQESQRNLKGRIGAVEVNILLCVLMKLLCNRTAHLPSRGLVSFSRE